MPLTLDTGRSRKPRRTVLYGPGGIGKSTWAATIDPKTGRPQMPGVVFIPTEEGVNDLPPEVARYPLCSEWEQMMAYIGELCTEQHDFRVMVLDTADWAEKLAWSAICKQAGVDVIGDIKYGKGYGFSVQWFRQLTMAMDYLRNTRGMDIVILAHAKTEKFEDPEHTSYDRYSPKMHDHVNNLLIEWADEVFFANFKTVVKEEDAGFNRTIGKAKTTGQRILRTTARPAAIAKNRLAMPDEIPFEWAEYARYRQF